MKNKLLLIILLSSISALQLIAQSNCAPEAFILNDTVICNDSATIVLGFNGGSESFDCLQPDGTLGPCDVAWGVNPGVDFNQPYIPSPDGNGYLWMGATISSQITGGNGQPRTVTSPPYNTSCGGEICFDFVYADGSSGSYNPPQNGISTPEQPDLYDEGIGLQYSTDGGVTWTYIRYWAPNGAVLPANPGVSTPSVGLEGAFEEWQDDTCVIIPSMAIGPSVQFRFLQEDDSGYCCDHWGIDDISVSIETDTMDVFLITSGGTNTYIGRTPDSIKVAPLTDSVYYFLFTNTTLPPPNNGTYVAQDTVYSYMAPLNAGPDVQIACSTIGTQLDIVSGVMPWSDVTWTPTAGLSNPNIQNPYANPMDDQLYIAQSDCGVDSTLVNVVPFYNAIASTTNDSICVGEMTTLLANSTEPSYSYTYFWSPATVSNDTMATTTAFPTTNTTYILEMTSDSGCVRSDSVNVVVGAIPKTIDYFGEMRLCRGDSTQITAVPIQPTFFDDFEIGANPSIWDSTYNASANTDCGIPFTSSTNTLHFNGAGPRGVQTFTLDASLGGNISFWLIYGSTFGSGPCEDVSFNAEMQLQYSTDGGTTWVMIRNYENNQHDNWALQSDTIPTAAQTTATIFRLHQLNNAGNNTDNWAIDDFLLELNCSGSGCTQYSYSWTPTATLSNPNIEDPYFFPNMSTWYTVSISPTGFNCNAAADSIFIEVDELNLSINPTDTFLCEPSPVILDGNIEGLSNSCNEEYNMYSIPFIVETGTGVTLNWDSQDDGETIVNLPFDFEYFCQNVNTVIPQTNGVLNMQDNGFDNDDFSPDQLPTSNFSPNGIIALMWDDLSQPSGTNSEFFTNGSAPNRKAVFNFDLTTGTSGTGNPVQGQIVLHETTNIIDITCVNCQPAGSGAFDLATQGIENFNGTIGYPTPGRNLTNWSATNETWRFVPANSPANFSYEWTPNIALNNDTILNPIAEPNSSTTYTFSVLNINNCLFEDSVEIEIYEPNATLSPNQNLCFGDSIQLLASGADTYTWSPSLGLNDTTIANPKTGIDTDIWYHVTFDTQGCIEEDSVFINILNLPQLEVNNGINPVDMCEGETKELKLTNPVTGSFTWSTLETGSSITVSTPGTYSVEYFDGNCTNETEITVIERPTPQFDIANLNNDLCCRDDSLVLDFNSISTTPYSSIYINEDEITTPTYTYLSEGINFVKLDEIKIVSNYGCENKQPIEIRTNCLNPKITDLSSSSLDTIYINTSETYDLTINEPENGTVSYTWSTSQPGTNVIVDPTVQDAEVNGITEGSMYSIGVSVIATFDGKECPEEVATATDYDVVEVKDPEFPDAFSPNGDGINDVFRPIIYTLGTTEDLRIYNRWGELMYDFKTAENKNGWDGNVNGQKQPQDVYLYYTTVNLPDGRSFVLEGSFSLLR